ncbi:SMC-Scp complex subunit ScpB [uncultured Bifidobacterium sp.]|uniref:SMC-Scp complex subunit ScpB n=1 Tax=uncultured Bifidobacterium sp. TaxID=165187 RepID=UPI0028DC49AF|nr:SMC-Scp complex subunit ScpB [uncultured Bifidobacterium sp.]
MMDVSMPVEEIRARLEAVLMAADGPMGATELAKAVQVDEREVLRQLDALRRDYDGEDPDSDGSSDVAADPTARVRVAPRTHDGGRDGDDRAVAAGGGAAVGRPLRPRGFRLVKGVRGWRLASREEFAPVIARAMAGTQPSRLSPAALESLAIVAYKQPVTRAQVTSIRGVASDGSIRLLLLRGLIREQGGDPETHAALLVTTEEFLDRMGLDSLDGLADLAPLLPASAREALRDDPRGVAGRP